MVGYLVAIFLPPIPMLQQGKMGTALLTFLMCCTGVLWPLASIWAVIATRDTHIEDKRVSRTSKAQPTWAQAPQPQAQAPQPQARACPACASPVTVGLTICPSCGFDFAAAARAGASPAAQEEPSRPAWPPASR